MLIFPNGTAYFNYSLDSAKDIGEDGFPLANGLFSAGIQCNIETLTENKRGKGEDGVYPICTLSVSIDYDSIGDNFHPTQVRLTHQYKGGLGTFTIQRIEYYDLTRTIQIWV